MRAHQLTSSSTRIRLPDFLPLRDSQPPADARPFLGANRILPAQIQVPRELKTPEENPFPWMGPESPAPLRRVSATSNHKKPLRTGQGRGEARVKQAYSLSGSILRATQFVVQFEAVPWGREHYADGLFSQSTRAPLPFEAVRLLGIEDPVRAVEFFTAWGGIPRYWELAEALGRNTRENLVELVLAPQGPLHSEPTRLLLEEQPPAAELKPILDAIGMGAHRVSEIAGRIGKPATSLGRAFDRLGRLGLVLRETPFGEAPRNSKRSLYRIEDPFLRLWFRMVSPHRAALTGGNHETRLALLLRHWPGLVAACWEDPSRRAIPRLDNQQGLGAVAAFGPST